MLFAFETENEYDKFHFLYTQYQKPLYYTALKITKDTDLAQEAVQDTYLKISKVLDRIDIEQRPQSYAYLKTTLRRICLYKLSQEKKELHADLSEMEVESDFDVEASVLQSLNNELLKQIIGELKPEYQLPLIYKYYFDYSDKQTAELLGITPTNVSVRLVRAKRKLLEKIEERGALFDVEVSTK